MTLVPCIWCDGTLAEQARAYARLFPDARIGGVGWADWQPAPGQIFVMLELAGSPLALLDGGPMARPDPAISLFVQRETQAEVDAIWQALIDGGTETSPLADYPWSPRYGFLTDRWGLSWQVSQGPLADVGQAVTPALVFSGPVLGQADAALDLYRRAFPGARTDGVLHHDGTGPDAAGTILHAQLRTPSGALMLMDSAEAAGWTFGWGTSLMVVCDGQDRIDRLWAHLVAGGGQAGRCGWLKDPFGVSWQITPQALLRLTDPGRPDFDPDRAARVTVAMMTMGKLDLAALEAAAAR